MCGIAGFFHPALAIEAYPETLLGMLQAIAHRGPDASGYVMDARCGLGSTRLSIIDVEAGVQPLSDVTRRYWLCYNGEIYNYLELRDELEALGCRFATHSDTEVLLQAWIQWGAACLPRLNGGFAFALYDRDRDELILARDRYGKRPLFYAASGEGLLFASEMKAFMAFPGFVFEHDPEQLASIVAVWTPLPEQTGFRGIHQLPMGHWLRCRPAGTEIVAYESLDFEGDTAVASEAEALELIRQQLRQSVALRLRSDVEVGVYLSGGVDSAIVALLAKELSAHPLATFSIGFADQQYDESAQQREMAALLGSRHHALNISHRDIVDNFPAAAWHAEIPAFRSAFVPMYLLSALTRQAGIKVVLSGEGADEAFLGYDLFKEVLLREAWADLDEVQRRARLERLYPHLAHYGPQDIAALTGLYQQFSGERMPGLFSHELRFQNGRFAARLIKNAGDPFAAISSLVSAAPGYAGMTSIHKAQWLEFRTLLAGYLLSTQGERMSLAHGVENRCPFLDPAVVKAAAAVNLRFDDGYDEKRLLRQAFRDKLPPAIVDKRKFPYRAPDSAAFVDCRPDYLELLLSADELAKMPFLDGKFARSLGQKIINSPPAEISTKENQAFIFLLSIALQHRFFVQHATPPIRKWADSPLVRGIDLRHQAPMPE
ncbi:MAG: asparagine synthase (glutamine-hydrolyzing) [Sterolibacteriaceae bacterium MAG5]|nr:asparagine synthase (glutamine-hydrolyzing) [Candidatus Nitricoxidireducens bremensis]